MSNMCFLYILSIFYFLFFVECDTFKRGTVAHRTDDIAKPLVASISIVSPLENAHAVVYTTQATLQYVA